MSKKRKNKYVRNRDALLVVTYGGVHHQENAGLPVPIPVNNLVSLTGNCLVLTGGLNAHGYGTRNGKYEHRRYYEEYKGVIGDGMGVNHLCGRPYCVQSAHLYQGTAGDNARDRRLHRGGAKWGDMIRVRDAEVGPVIYDTPPHTHSLWTEGRSLECPHEWWSGICAICGRPKGPLSSGKYIVSVAVMNANEGSRVRVDWSPCPEPGGTSVVSFMPFAAGDSLADGDWALWIVDLVRGQVEPYAGPKP